MKVHLLAAATLLAGACTAPTDNDEDVAPPSAPADTSREIAFIVNAEAATVSLLDIETLAVIGAININPEDIVVARPGTPNYAQDSDLSPDGRTLYVSRGYAGDVAAFDIATGQQLWATRVDPVRADHMTITQDGAHLFVSALTVNRVRRIDTQTGAVTGEFVSGVYPHDTQVSPDGAQVFNTSLGNMQTPFEARDSIDSPTDNSGYAYELTVADAATLEIEDRIRMPNGVRPWHMRPARDAFYAQTHNHHGVILYSYPGAEELARLDLPVANGVSEQDWDFEAPHHGLALTHDGDTLCLAGRASDYAALVNAPDLSLIATIPVGDAPGWASLARNDEICLLPNSREGTVSVISVEAAEEIARIDVGAGPKHITVGAVPGDVLDTLAGQ